MRHGPGACKYKDNGVYEGMFRKDDRHGHGVHTETNGDRPSTCCFADHFFQVECTALLAQRYGPDSHSC